MLLLIKHSAEDSKDQSDDPGPASKRPGFSGNTVIKLSDVVHSKFVALLHPDQMKWFSWSVCLLDASLCSNLHSF